MASLSLRLRQCGRLVTLARAAGRDSRAVCGIGRVGEVSAQWHPARTACAPLSHARRSLATSLPLWKSKDSEKARAEEEEAQKEKELMARLSTSEKLRYITSKYGRVAIGLYLTIGMTDLLLLYAAIRMGFDVKPAIDALFHATGLEMRDFLSPSMGTFFAAYTVHKVCVRVCVSEQCAFTDWKQNQILCDSRRISVTSPLPMALSPTTTSF